MTEVFISYSSQDRAFVEPLASDLVAHGITVWFDRWEMRPGDSLLGKIAEAISTSAYLFAILSPASVSSRWVMQELKQAMNEEIGSARVKVVPIIHRQCSIPPFLVDKVYVNFENEPYDYALQLLIDLVFDHPISHNRPQFARKLIDRYQEGIRSAHPDLQEFPSIVGDLIHVLKSQVGSLLSASVDYVRYQMRLGELHRASSDFQQALDCYEAAYAAALEYDDEDLSVRSGIAVACLQAFSRQRNLAEETWESLIEKLAASVDEGYSIDLHALVEAVVEFCFYEDMGVENPLTLVLDNDHHRLNLRISHAVDTFYTVLSRGATEGENPGVLAFSVGQILEGLGVLRLALKYYSLAREKGHADAEVRVEKVQAAQFSAAAIAKWMFSAEEPMGAVDLGKGFTISSPGAFKRIMLCSGRYVKPDRAMEEVFSRTPRDRTEYRTNNVLPVRVLLYECELGSGREIGDHLAAANVGVALVDNDEAAKAALHEHPTIQLLVCDHHSEPDEGMVSISDVMFERDWAKKHHPSISSMLLCKGPDERMARGFLAGGGDQVVRSEGMSVRRLSAAIRATLERL